MESDSSQLFRGVTPEHDPTPATERNEDQSREMVPGSGLMVMENDLVGLVKNKLKMSQILDQIQEIAEGEICEEIDKHYTTLEYLLKGRTAEVERKEKSAMERIVELEKKEERLKEVEERERKVGLLEKSMTLRLQEKEKEYDVKQYLISSVLRLVCEKVNEEAAKELEERGKEVERLSKCNDDKSSELDKAVKEFDLKKIKEAEVVKESLKQIEEREKELSILDEAIKEKVTELEKKKEIFEAEQKVKAEEMDLKIKEMLDELEKKEMIFEVKQKARSEEMDVKEKELQKREKELELKQRELAEVMDELEQRGKEVERLSKLNDEKSRELNRTMKEFNMRQKKVEIVKECIKPLEVMEKDLSLLKEAIKEFTEVEKKDEILEAEQKTKDEEMKKKLEERELQERSIQAETCKRPRVQLLAKKGSEAESVISPAKKHKSHCHDDANKETNSARVVSASRSSREQISKAYEAETDEEPEQIKIVDSEFHDFKKTMSSFMVGKVWALYDPKDYMPRLYAKIKRIIKSRSSLEVTWLEPRDKESVPVASGRFTYGRSEIVSHLAFSHQLKPIIRGRNFIAVNPKEGETWALFRDWSESWDNNPEQYEPPYRYDLVAVVLGFEDHRGVGVSYLGKVKGFVSVFEHAAQHGVSQRVIAPKEMHRFSHRVPSVRLNGEEKEGVPVGSFELDPAAVPSCILLAEKEDGSRKDVPIIIS